jgi:hypothetical protein
MATGDVYEVIDVQTQEGQQILNVYFYYQALPLVPLSGTIAQALAEDWADLFIPLLVDFQVDTLVHEEVRCRNLFDEDDVGITITGDAGSNETSEALPTFLAVGMKFNHDKPSVRPGGKRLPGLYEVIQDEGVIVAGAVGKLDDLAEALAEPLPAGILIPVDTMYPCVVKRVREGDPGEYEYRLPEATGELIFGTVIEVLWDLLITSQVSRKIGVGA